MRVHTHLFLKCYDYPAIDKIFLFIYRQNKRPKDEAVNVIMKSGWYGVAKKSNQIQ